MASGTLRSDALGNVTRLVDAARQLFRTDGHTTLSSIAGHAGVAVATLYRHFPSREALARTVLDRLLDEELRPLFAELARSTAPRDALLDLAERLLAALERESGVVAAVGGQLAEAADEFFRARTPEISAMVVRAQESGNLRADLDADDVPALLTAAATGMGVVGPDRRRRYLALLLDGLNPVRAEVLPR